MSKMIAEKVPDGIMLQEPKVAGSLVHEKEEIALHVNSKKEASLYREKSV